MRKAMFGRNCLALMTCGIAAAARADAQLPLSSPPAAMVGDFGVTKVRRPANWLPAGLMTPHTQAVFDPPFIRFRNGRATLSDRAVVRSTHAEFGPTHGLLTLDLTRIRRSAGEARQTIGPRRDRSSVLSMEAGYAMRVDENDIIRLTATIGTEKHKTPIAIADGRSTGTSTRAIGAGWRHDGFQFEAGWFEADAFRSATTVDRTISLAAGSAIAEQGYQAGVGVPLDRRARLGIHIVSALIDQQDRSALGAVVSRDVRTTLSLGIQFR